MKIAYIGQKGIPAKFGGVERYVEEVAKRMAKEGHDVFVYVRNNYTDKKLKEYRGIRIVNLPSIPGKNFDAISHTFLASWHALFQNYDLIHYHSIGPTSLSFIPKIFLRKTAIVSTFQCQDYNHQKWGAFARGYLRFSEYLTCKIPDAVITITKNLYDHALKNYGTKTVIIPNGSAVNESIGRTDILARWRLNRNEYILSVSRLIRHKGIHYLIRAFKNLEDKNLTGGKKLVIVGDGFHTDDYVAQLKNEAVGRDSIVFTGNLTGDDLAEIFSRAYVFVQPSESEGLSMSILEAMGYRKTVLASDIPENQEALDGCGFYFKNKNAADLEEKLAALFQDQKVIFAMGAKAKERVEKEFNWDIIAKKIETVYRETILKKNEKK